MTWHNFDSDDDYDDDDCCSNAVEFLFSVCVCVHKCGSDRSGSDCRYTVCSDVQMFKCLSNLMNEPTYYLRTFKHHYVILFHFVSFCFVFILIGIRNSSTNRERLKPRIIAVHWTAFLYHEEAQTYH